MTTEDKITQRPLTNGLIVVKVGGSALGNHDTMLHDLVFLQKKGFNLAVVHGGGQTISKWMERQGTRPRFVRGLRVTDRQSLDIVTAVLTGLVNKQLVASIIALGGKAIGLSGVDGGLLECRIADPELGYVGEVKKVNITPLEQSLKGGYIPLIAPVGLHENDGSKNAGCMLNINGDTVTGHVAQSLGASRMIFLTDVEGVLDGSGRMVPRLNTRQAQMFIRSGIVKGGMIPKLEACLKAMPNVPTTNIVDGRIRGALKRCVFGETMGTQVQDIP